LQLELLHNALLAHLRHIAPLVRPKKSTEALNLPKSEPEPVPEEEIEEEEEGEGGEKRVLKAEQSAVRRRAAKVEAAERGKAIRAAEQRNAIRVRELADSLGESARNVLAKLSLQPSSLIKLKAEPEW
jgi:hypothetical protein